MKRMFVFMLAAALFVSSLGASKAFAADNAHYYFGFDESVKPWSAGSNDGLVKENTLTLGLDEMSARIKPGGGNKYAALANEYGNVVWMKTTLASPGRNVKVEFLTKDLQGCQGCIAIVYVGRTNPLFPGQFKTNYKGIGKDWGYEGFDFALDNDYVKGGDIGNNMVVAIGFTMLDGLDGAANCPEQKQIAIDNLHVTVSSPVDS